MVVRHNPDLDDAFLDSPPNGSVRQPAKGQRKRRSSGKRDELRRRAFKVLACIADLGAQDRAAVLAAAERLNRA